MSAESSRTEWWIDYTPPQPWDEDEIPPERVILARGIQSLAVAVNDGMVLFADAVTNVAKALARWNGARSNFILVDEVVKAFPDHPNVKEICAKDNPMGLPRRPTNHGPRRGSTFDRSGRRRY